jgi:Carboxypeptidase regulatory-like domain
MSKPSILRLLPVVAFLSLVSPASAQTIRGLVTEAATGQPISLATVTLVFESGEHLGTALTTAEGFFSLEGDREGAYLIRATALGYSPARAGPVHLATGTTHVLEIPLTVAPIDIEGLVVQGESEGLVGNYLTQKGFWERYERGRGQFLTPGEVLSSDAMFTPHLLRGLKHIVPQFGAAPWSVWPLLGVTGVAPVWWTPDLLGERSPSWRERDHRTRRSFGSS